MLVHLAHNGMSLIELSVFHWFCALVAVSVYSIDWWRISLPYPPWNNVFVTLTHFATKMYTDTFILTIWSCLVCTLQLGDWIANAHLNEQSTSITNRYTSYSLMSCWYFIRKLFRKTKLIWRETSKS